METLSRPVFPETVALIVICLLDMGTTLIYVRSGHATEANPVLKHSLQVSNGSFIMLKTAFYLGPIILLELIGRYKPDMIRNAIRACLFGYVCLYIVGIISVAVFQQ